MIKISHPELLFNGEKLFRSSLSSTLLKDNKLNRKNKLVLAYDNSGTELSADHKELLEKLASACKYSIDQTLLLNLAMEKGSIAEIQNNYNPNVILLFGDVKVSRNITGLRKNFPYNFGGVKVLRAESLEKLQKDKSEKSALWGSLQEMLNLA